MQSQDVWLALLSNLEHANTMLADTCRVVSDLRRLHNQHESGPVAHCTSSLELCASFSRVAYRDMMTKTSPAFEYSLGLFSRHKRYASQANPSKDASQKLAMLNFLNGTNMKHAFGAG